MAKKGAQYIQAMWAPVLVHKALSHVNTWLDSPEREDQVLGVKAVSSLKSVLMPPLAPEKSKGFGEISPQLLQDMEARLGRRIQLTQADEVEDADYIPSDPVEINIATPQIAHDAAPKVGAGGGAGRPPKLRRAPDPNPPKCHTIRETFAPTVGSERIDPADVFGLEGDE